MRSNLTLLKKKPFLTFFFVKSWNDDFKLTWINLSNPGFIACMFKPKILLFKLDFKIK